MLINTGFRNTIIQRHWSMLLDRQIQHSDSSYNLITKSYVIQSLDSYSRMKLLTLNLYEDLLVWLEPIPAESLSLCQPTSCDLKKQYMLEDVWIGNSIVIMVWLTCDVFEWFIHFWSASSHWLSNLVICCYCQSMR